MSSSFVYYGLSCIHYLQFGQGTSVVIAFHGYAESASSFTCLESHLDGRFTVIAIDLPFHGATQWKEERAFSNHDIACIIDEILKSAGITSKDFIALGYSMGGRVALSLAESLPDRVSRLVLLAPDGMKVNFWYWLATQTTPGIRLFHFTMKKPRWFFNLLRIADKFKLVNKSIVKFIFNHIDDEDVRYELFHRWTCMRNIKPDLKKIRSIIKQRKLTVRMVYGKHDRIILAKRASLFCEGLDAFCRIYVIDAGHQVLERKHAALIATLLTA